MARGRSAHPRITIQNGFNLIGKSCLIWKEVVNHPGGVPETAIEERLENPALTIRARRFLKIRKARSPFLPPLPGGIASPRTPVVALVPRLTTG